MPPRKQASRIDAPKASHIGCPSCLSDDPHTKSRHFLLLAHVSAETGEILAPGAGLDQLRQHLSMHFAQMRDPDVRGMAINDVVAWVASEQKAYVGYVDPADGAPLTWWEARAHCHKSTRETTPDTDYLDAQWHKTADTMRMPATEVQALLTRVLSARAKDAWARGHIFLMESGVNVPGREAEAAALCRRFAVHWPHDRVAWEREAVWWEAGAPQGVAVLERQPGEDEE